MRKTLTIIAALVFTIQILVSISAIFATPPAGAIDITTIPPEEMPVEGTVYIPIDIESTVFYTVFFAAGLCLSIAVLLPDKKSNAASLNISEQTQNITALKKNLVIIATIGFGLDLLFNNIIPYLQDFFMSWNVRYWALLFRDNLWIYTFNMSIPVAGLCLSIAVLLPYKEPKAAPAEMSQQSLTITAMKKKLAIIALVFCGISIVYFSYVFLLELLEGNLHLIVFMLSKIAVLCLSIAVLLPYKKAAETSCANTVARRVKN